MARDCSPRAKATRPCRRHKFECRTCGRLSRRVSGERPRTVPACARSPCKRYDSASMTRTPSSSSRVRDEGVRSSGASSSIVVAAWPRSSVATARALAAREGAQIRHLRPSVPTLEDVFARAVGEV